MIEAKLGQHMMSKSVSDSRYLATHCNTCFCTYTFHNSQRRYGRHENFYWRAKRSDGYLYIVLRGVWCLKIQHLTAKHLQTDCTSPHKNDFVDLTKGYLILDYYQVRTVSPNRTQIWYHPPLPSHSLPSSSKSLVPARIFTPIIPQTFLLPPKKTFKNDRR